MCECCDSVIGCEVFDYFLGNNVTIAFQQSKCVCGFIFFRICVFAVDTLIRTCFIEIAKECV